MRTWQLLPACVILCISTLRAQPGTPTIYSGGVVNAADYTGSLAHGSIISVWGTDLAASTASAA